MSLALFIAQADSPAFPSGLPIGDPTAGSAGNPAFRAFASQIVAKLWTLVTDNLALIVAVVLAYACIEWGGTLYRWVRSGFGKWDDNGQGSLF